MTRDPDVIKQPVALRIVRIKNGELLQYEPIRTNISMVLNRLKGCFASIQPKEYALIDLLDENGDIVGEQKISREEFLYLRRTLKFRRDWEAQL